MRRSWEKVDVSRADFSCSTVSGARGSITTFTQSPRGLLFYFYFSVDFTIIEKILQGDSLWLITLNRLCLFWRIISVQQCYRRLSARKSWADQ